MPEQLQERGITWKVYSADNFSNFEDPPFSFFAQYYSRPELNARGLQPTYPADFMADVARARCRRSRGSTRRSCRASTRRRR